MDTGVDTVVDAGIVETVGTVVLIAAGVWVDLMIRICCDLALDMEFVSVRLNGD